MKSPLLKWSIILIMAALAVASSPAQGASKITGAAIDENGLQTITVSQSRGRDGNPGTTDLPVASLPPAFDLARKNLAKGIGTRVLIEPGVYRSTGITIDGEKLGETARLTPLVIESTPAQAVDWRGSIIVTGWKPVDKSRGIYRVPWTGSAGDVDAEAKITPPVDEKTPRNLTAEIPNGSPLAVFRWNAPEAANPTSYVLYQVINSSAPTVVQKDIAGTSCEVVKPSIFTTSDYFVAAILPDGTESSPSNRVTLGWASRWIPNVLGRRTEMVFLTGELLQQVESPGHLRVGTFAISKDRIGENEFLYIQTYPQFSVNVYEIEVSNTEPLQPLLTIQNKKNIAIKGIRFQHAGSHPHLSGAVHIRNCENVLIAGNEFSWNNSFGLLMNGVNHLTLHANRATHNGGCGIGGGTGKNQIWTNNVCSQNGWRCLLLGGENGFFHAGIKTGFGLRDAIFRNNQTNDNDALGFWLDSDMQNILVEDHKSIGNGRVGIALEASKGPIIVRNSVAIRNSRGGIAYGDVGNVTLEGNVFADNHPYQIRIGIHMEDGKPGRLVKDRETQQEYWAAPASETWTGNLVAALRSDQKLIVFEWGNIFSYLPFFNGLKARNNQYWHPNSEKIFPSLLPKNMMPVTFEQWKNALKASRPAEDAESGSIWKMPDVSSIGDQINGQIQASSD